MQAFVPKNRRPKFELQLKIFDLNNVPLVSGTSYVKWHLPSSTATEHHGRTPKSPIKDHKVVWDYQKTINVRLTVDRNNVLEKTAIDFEVHQEYSSGLTRNERIELGRLTLNLAEYVEATEADVEGEDGVVRRYLMQESKINSTMKIAVNMTQIEGDRSFTAPELKSARVFGGIAGVVSPENVEEDELGQLPAITNTNSNTGEFREQQDMYRRTLAASWAAQAGELPADECIENIFAGGNGWRDQNARGISQIGAEQVESIIGDFQKGHRKGKSSGGLFGFVRPTPKPRSPTKARKQPNLTATSPSTGSSGESDSKNVNDGVPTQRNLPYSGVKEMDVREDLQSWSLPSSAD